MPAPILAAVLAGIAAALAKGTATVGGSIAGGVVSYYIEDSIRGEDQPQISHAILTSASENKSDSLLAVNFGGAESGLILMTILIVATFVTYICGWICQYHCCKHMKQSSKKLQRAAIANMAAALGPHLQQEEPSYIKNKLD